MTYCHLLSILNLVFLLFLSTCKKKIEEITYKTSESANEGTVNIRIFSIFWEK